MGFLRRLLGGEAAAELAIAPLEATAEATEELEHELEVMRDEQDRLSDLAIRQLRYSKYAWQPPAQGGERRADDSDRSDPHGGRDRDDT